MPCTPIPWGVPLPALRAESDAACAYAEAAQEHAEMARQHAARLRFLLRCAEAQEPAWCALRGPEPLTPHCRRSEP